MNQNALLALAASAGIAVGAGGTWFAVSNSTSNAKALAKADIVAAINADPTLCPVPDEPVSSAKLDVPTQAEALIAVRKLEEKNPLLWDRNELAGLEVTMHTCWPTDETRTMVECITTVRKNPSAKYIGRTIGFAKDQSSGEWIAIDRK
ncbi:hypothetical protein NO134_21920 [Ochrobactrum sp. BD22]